MDTKRPTIPAAEEILGGYFPVLDHGFVALVDYMGSDEDVERAARVSYGYGTRKVSATRGLVRYLRRHRHTTPSEMVELKLHCAMPMFVARQWIRHRTASVNELSARYSLMPLLFYTPQEEHFALQSRSNRQGREGGAPPEVYREALERWERLRRDAGDAYGWLLEEDVAREIARIDLPVSTYTQWYWKIDLHNLLHFLSLRVDPRAQWEIQQFARVIAGMVKRVAPLSYEAWVDYDLESRPLTRVERDVLSRLLTADAGGVRVKDGAAVITDELEELGLSNREITELAEKLQAPGRPDFELDLSAMRTAEEMAEEMYEAVPDTFE
jgi:thymidylate synthase (FAD)